MHGSPLVGILLISILLGLLSGAAPLVAQASDTSRIPPPRLGIIAGYHFGTHDHVEVGIGGLIVPEDGNPRTLAMGLSGEMRLGGREKVAGIVASLWSGRVARTGLGAGPIAIGVMPGAISTGLGIGYYTNFKGESTLRLRPELIVGLGHGASVGYSYSCLLSGPGFNGLNKHDFTFRWFLPWSR